MSTDRLITECPAGCGTDLVGTDIVLAEGSLLRCTGCGHLVSQIQPEAYLAALQKFDSERGTLPSASDQDRHDQRAAKLFHRVRAMLGLRAEETMRLLDVGCSTGALILSALRERIDAEGCEPAERAARAAQAAGLRVFPGTLESAAYPSRHFQAVTLMEVIEHLQGPSALFREIHRILAPNGVLVVGTGNAASWTVSLMGGRWDYFLVEPFGGHVSFFTPRSLARLAERCGFRLERLDTQRVRFVESHQATPMVYRSLKILAEALNVPARCLDKGHDMLAFLRKI